MNKICFAILCFALPITGAAQPEAPVVAVAQILEHQALDTLREGLKDGLKNQAIEWVYENAQGNQATAIQIGRKLIGRNPQVIVTLSTPMTQAVSKATSRIPIVFGAVTDPKDAKLTAKNITGLTDFVPPEDSLKLVKSFLPQIKTLGVIYNPGEVNSRKQVDLIKKLGEAQNIVIKEVPITRTSEALMAIKGSVDTVDAFFLPTDNTVVSAIDGILKICSQQSIPVFGNDVALVKKGILAAQGIDWNQVGHSLAHIVQEILKGKSIEEMPIQSPKNLELYINKVAAKQLGISIPPDLYKKAYIIPQ